MPKILTIELPDELEQKLALEAEKLDISLEALIVQSLSQLAEQFDRDDEPQAVVLASLRRSLRNLRAGQVFSVAELWPGKDGSEGDADQGNSPPLIQVEFSTEFQQRLQKLIQRYPHCLTDLQPALTQLQSGRFMGDCFAGSGYTLFRMLIPNSDLPERPRAAYRLVYQMQSSTHLLLLLLYVKSGLDNLPLAQLHTAIIEDHNSESVH